MLWVISSYLKMSVAYILMFNEFIACLFHYFMVLSFTLKFVKGLG